MAKVVGSAFPNLTPADFQDPTLFKVNTILSLMWNKVGGSTATSSTTGLSVPTSGSGFLGQSGGGTPSSVPTTPGGTGPGTPGPPGPPGPLPTPPLNVTGITINYAYLDPLALTITISVSFTPPGSGTYTGVHMWLEIPDQSSGSTTTQTVGSTPVGTGTVSGVWAPIDLGIFQFQTQPWLITIGFPAGLGLNPDQNIPCRLYLASISLDVDNGLIRNGLAGATPNVAFLLISLASGSPSAGTNIAPNCGTVTCTVLTNQNVSGKLVTPVLVLMGSVPSNPPPNWGYRLYVSYGTADPTNPKNLTPVTGVETVAGVVPAPPQGDGVSELNTFILATPTATTNVTVWALAGLTISGVFTPNNLVVGITNGCPITIGVNTGTIDASQAIQTSIANRLAVILGKLDINPASLNASTYIEAGTIVGGLLAASNIITLSAQIGFEVVGDSNIGSLNVSKLLAGTATFTSTVIFQDNAGTEYVAISSTGVEIASQNYSVSVTGSTGIEISYPSGPSLALTASSLTITSGSYSLDITASKVQLSNGTQQVLLNSGAIYVEANSSNYLAITPSEFTYVSGGSTVLAVDATAGGTLTIGTGVPTTVGDFSVGIGTGTVSCNNLNATSGTTTLYPTIVIGNPSSPSGTTININTDINFGSPGTQLGYIFISVQGTPYKFPFYS